MRYNVYDKSNNLISKDKRPIEIAEQLKLSESSKISLSSYADHGMLVERKYRVEKVETDPKPKQFSHASQKIEKDCKMVIKCAELIRSGKGRVITTDKGNFTVII